MFGWCTFMKLIVDEERLVRSLRRVIEKLHRRLLDVRIEVRNADDAVGYVTPSIVMGARLVHILAVDLELFVRCLAGVAGHHALGHLVEHGTKLIRHVREPRRVAVGVGIEVIDAAILHHVVAVGIGQRVICFARDAICR